MRLELVTATVVVSSGASSGTLAFGLYDGATPPTQQGGGWELMSAADFETPRYKTAFVEQYNSALGIPIIAPFESGNCCIMVRGGEMLTISACTGDSCTDAGTQFPALARSGASYCSPPGTCVLPSVFCLPN